MKIRRREDLLSRATCVRAASNGGAGGGESGVAAAGAVSLGLTLIPTSDTPFLGEFCELGCLGFLSPVRRGRAVGRIRR